MRKKSGDSIVEFVMFIIVLGFVSSIGADFFSILITY